ncbi:M56 family metallopeptidase [Paenibacillus sp. NPDC056579]|uniref:M56 family metallopeptidase n=1 Tax=Paenibacillus sp. NPDC056579 TaxID=3345871 RepID=UPI00369CEF1E
MWENRSKLIFISCMLIAGVMFAQMGMYIMHALAGWQIRYNVIQLCHTMIRSLGMLWVGYILNAIVFSTFALSIWIAARQLYLSRRFYRKLMSWRSDSLTHDLNQRYSGGQYSIAVVQCSKPMAFAMGLIKPQIVLSTGLVDMLDRRELEAVIHHETYHRNHYDPLKTFLMSLCASVMWYIPILKSFHQNYKIVREVLADNYAISKTGDSVHLGSALLKLLKGNSPVQMPFSHVSFSDTSINFRIRQLLDPQTELPLKWPFTPAMISVQVLFALCTMFVLVMN